MNDGSRQGKNENIKNKKTDRKKKILAGKIVLTCVIIILAIAIGIFVKHSVNQKAANNEDSAIITASPETNSKANMNLQPITAPTTTTEPETTEENSETNTNLQSATDPTATANQAAANSATTEAVPANADNNQAVNGYKYLLKVNRTQNIVTAYTADENGNYTVPAKAMVCSVGLNGNTPTGTFKTTDKYTWRLLSGNVYGQYATRITGHILFHSVPYYTQNKSDLEAEEYNKLGQAASLGCVRLSVQDAKWIYDNCKSGTTVTIYDSTQPEPLKPPNPIKIDLNDSRKGWDPTDPDPNNPW